MPNQKTYLEAPIPENEKERIISLRSLGILDTPPEERFDRITKLAVHLFKIPISTITLIDSKREWFKSCQGLSKREGKRAISFCGHALLDEDLFIVPDAKKDERFANNPMVKGPPFIRFYAAFPLKAADGKKVGVFCIKDHKPRRLAKEQISLLKDLSAWAELELNTHELNLAIEARSRAETKISELNEVIQLLYKSLKHDLLNNLTVIKGYIEMYQKSGKKELLKWILKSIDQGTDSIRQMSKLESAISIGSTLKPYQLRKAIENVSTFFPTVKFKIKGEGEVLVDQAILSVVENIIRNAQIHGKTKRMDINIKNAKKFVEISFTDFGKGIPSSIKNKLFQEGFKYGSSGHTGLGLYIIKRTIGRYGGEVKIKNTKPKGTSVILKLPSAS